MGRRRRSSTLEDLAEVMEVVFRYVPPWLSLPLATVAFIGISSWINSRLVTPGQTFGYLLGGLIAVPILIGGVGGYRYRRKRADFFRQNLTLEWVNKLTWREFEELVGDVFRARGYAVENVGGGGADGGIDLRLVQNGERTLVQCKRWKVFKVGVKPIREFYGVMMSERVDRGVFVSSGVYTNEALSFAEGKPLELIDGAQFAAMAKDFQANALGGRSRSTGTAVIEPVPERPRCPKCGTGMVLRRAKTGKNVGQKFWGCGSFPQCRGTKSI